MRTDDTDVAILAERHGSCWPLANRWAWLLVVAVAFLLFELTADAALSVLVGCVKFGWDELRLARWVKRHHPDRLQGKVLARWLTAYGLWKTSGVAIVFMFILLFAHLKLRAPHRVAGVRAEAPLEFMTAALTMFFGFCLSGWYSILAAVSAYRHRSRIWIGRRGNRAKDILMTSAMFPLLPAWAVLTAPVLVLNLVAPALGYVVWALLFLMGLPIAFLWLIDRLGDRVLAASPEECWDVAWVDTRVPRSSQPLDPHLATIDEFGLEA